MNIDIKTLVLIFYIVVLFLCNRKSHKVGSMNKSNSEQWKRLKIIAPFLVILFVIFLVASNSNNNQKELEKTDPITNISNIQVKESVNTEPEEINDSLVTRRVIIDHFADAQSFNGTGKELVNKYQAFVKSDSFNSFKNHKYDYVLLSDIPSQHEFNIINEHIKQTENPYQYNKYVLKYYTQAHEDFDEPGDDDSIAIYSYIPMRSTQVENFEVFDFKLDGVKLKQPLLKGFLPVFIKDYNLETSDAVYYCAQDKMIRAIKNNLLYTNIIMEDNSDEYIMSEADSGEKVLKKSNSRFDKIEDFSNKELGTNYKEHYSYRIISNGKKLEVWDEVVSVKLKTCHKVENSKYM